MSTFVRTITTTMNPQDTVAQAESVAENLRSSGYAEVTVGPVYDNVTVKWYGMPSIDITYTVPDGPVVEASPKEPVDDAPEPMPVAEFGGSTADAALVTTEPPPGERFTGSSPTETAPNESFVPTTSSDLDTGVDTEEGQEEGHAR